MKMLAGATVVAGVMGVAGAGLAAGLMFTDGATLLEKRCATCHPAAMVQKAKKSAAQWDATVARMVGKGARLTADEKKVLVAYLAKTSPAK